MLSWEDRRTSDLQTVRRGLASRRVVGVFACVGGIACAAPSLAGAAAPLVVVAAVGGQAPGEPSNIKYVGFNFPLIGPDGTIAVGARVGTYPDFGPTTNNSYVALPGGPLGLLARQGGPVNGTPGYTHLNPGVTAVGNNGAVASLGRLFGPGNQVILAGTGSLTAYAYEGAAAPASVGGTYDASSNFLPPAINASGQVAFGAAVVGSTNGYGGYGGLYRVSGGTVEAVAVSDTPSPIAGQNYFQFYDAPAISDTGKVAFVASTRDEDSDRTGVFSGTPGAIQMVATQSQTAPGTGGATFATLQYSSPSTNRRGDVAFVGSLTESGPVNADNDTGIWSNIGGSVAPLAREGAAAPGLPAGTAFGEFLTYVPPSLNNKGQAAFIADLTGNLANPSGVFLGTPDGLKPLVLENQTVPGMPAGTRLTGFSNLNLNDAGQMFFAATFTGAGSFYPYDTALIGYDPATGLSVVAMSGVVSPGLSVAPAQVYITGDAGNLSSPNLSNAGQVVFTANFGSAQRIFTAFIPEPTATLALAALAFGFARRRSSGGRD